MQLLFCKESSQTTFVKLKRWPFHMRGSESKSFFASFCSQEEVLASYG
jgi:hypothetical protein